MVSATKDGFDECTPKLQIWKITHYLHLCICSWSIQHTHELNTIDYSGTKKHMMKNDIVRNLASWGCLRFGSFITWCRIFDHKNLALEWIVRNFVHSWAHFKPTVRNASKIPFLIGIPFSWSISLNEILIKIFLQWIPIKSCVFNAFPTVIGFNLNLSNKPSDEPNFEWLKLFWNVQWWSPLPFDSSINWILWRAKNAWSACKWVDFYISSDLNSKVTKIDQ